MLNVSQQWAAVEAAPVLYVGAILVVAGLTWAIIHFVYRQRLEWKDERIEALEAQIEQAKKINPAVPNEAQPVVGQPQPSRNWRKNMISGARALAVRYTNDNDARKPPWRHCFEGSSLYPQLRGYLSKEYLDKLQKPRTVYAQGESKYEPLVEWFLDELDRLEQEWQLR